MTSRQLLVVITPSRTAQEGLIFRFSRTSRQGKWIAAGKPMRVMVGKNGLAGSDPENGQIKGALEQKREGDNRTPVGLYAIGPAFGFQKSLSIKMNYLSLNYNSICVDDVNSVYYNQIVENDSIHLPDWKSGEVMRQHEQYKLGLVIQYNQHPTQANKGSCIFLHIWKGQGIATTGCIGMGEEDLLTTLKWLDKNKLPVIAIFPSEYYRSEQAILRLPAQINY